MSIIFWIAIINAWPLVPSPLFDSFNHRSVPSGPSVAAHEYQAIPHQSKSIAEWTVDEVIRWIQQFGVSEESLAILRGTFVI